jgi:hypothetical protein
MGMAFKIIHQLSGSIAGKKKEEWTQGCEQMLSLLRAQKATCFVVLTMVSEIITGCMQASYS